jgi:1-acyl-sn-glycerol-3-phosphate acyltransferase
VVLSVILNFVLRWLTLGLYARLVFRTTVVGRKNLPKGGFVLAVGPHKTAKETIVVPGHLPSREFHILIKAELWKGVVGWIFRNTRQIKVERQNGLGHKSLDPAVAALRRGFLVMLFPEGTRYPNDDVVHRGKPGAVHMALAAGVPIVPVGLIGMVDKNPRVKRRMVVGQPYDPFDLLHSAERHLINATGIDVTVTHRLTADLMKRIAVLAETDYQP